MVWAWEIVLYPLGLRVVFGKRESKHTVTYTIMMAMVMMMITINVENQSLVGFTFIKLLAKSASDGNTGGGGILTPSRLVVAKL